MPSRVGDGEDSYSPRAFFSRAGSRRRFERVRRTLENKAFAAGRAMKNHLRASFRVICCAPNRMALEHFFRRKIFP
jgi:hypothetical protein